MGKKKRNLIALALVLVLLVGALYVLMNRDEPVEETVIEETISLTDFAYGDINAITISSKEELFTLTKVDGTWLVDGQRSSNDLNQASIGKMIRKLIELEALNQLEEVAPEDLSPYGLDEPTALMAEIDGIGMKEIFVGNKTVKSSYYAMVSGDLGIYEIDLEVGDTLIASLNTYRLTDIMMPVDVLTLEQLTIKRHNNTTIELLASEINEVQTSATHILTKPYEQTREINSDRIEALFSGINTLTRVVDIIEDEPQDLALYGLDHPKIEIAIKDQQQEMSLLIGNYIDESEAMVYCSVLGQATVYSIDGSAVDYLASIEAYDLIFHFIMLVNIESIDEIVISNDEVSHVLAIEEEIYSINNNEVTPEEFVAIYQSMIGLSSDAEAEEITTIEDAVISIEYHNRAEGIVIGQVDFVPYNEFFYGAYANGAYMFVVAKETVDEIFDTLGD